MCVGETTNVGRLWLKVKVKRSGVASYPTRNQSLQISRGLHGTLRINKGLSNRCDLGYPRAA